MSIDFYAEKKNIPILIFIITSIFILFSYYTGLFSETRDVVTGWSRTIVNFSILFGLCAMVKYHGNNVIRLKKGWYYNAITLSAIFITSGLYYVNQPGYDWVVRNVVAVFEVAILGFTGFYNLTLFYRAARTRSFEASVLIISCILVMFYMVPIGDAIHPILPVIGKWVNDVPNSGAARGLIICMAIGMISLFIRSILGYEKAYMGGG